MIIRYIKYISLNKNPNINCQMPLADLGSLFVKDDTDLIKYNSSYLTSDFDIKKCCYVYIRLCMHRACHHACTISVC